MYVISPAFDVTCTELFQRNGPAVTDTYTLDDNNLCESVSGNFDYVDGTSDSTEYLTRQIYESLYC